jgi:hypothetical protein
MKSFTRALLAGCAVVAAGSGADVAFAQDAEVSPFVRDRDRPELDPLGVRFGSFFLFPQAVAGLGYESNVFAEENDTDGDFVATFEPSFRLVSDFSRHELRLVGRVAAGRYFEFEDENFTDYGLEAGGRYDFGNGAEASGALFHRRDHEGRADPDAVFAKEEPVVFTTTGVSGSFTQPFGRFSATVGAGARTLDFRDVALRGGGESNEDDRDRDAYDASLRLGYEIVPGYEAFVRGTYDWVRYDGRDDLGRDRENDGYEVVGGARIDLTGLVVGQVFAGYFEREYDDNAFNDPSGLSFGGRLDWALTGLTTLYGEARRNVVETTVAGASSIQQTVFLAGVDHELLRQLVLNGEARLVRDDFQGIAREEDTVRLSAGAVYTLNRNLFLEGGYSFVSRDSDAANRSYDNNIVLFRVGARL